MLLKNFNHRPHQYKYFTLLAMLVPTLFIAAASMAYRFSLVGEGIIESGGALILPTTYVLMDIITEVYGYELSKNLIWYTLVCNAVFTVVIIGIIHLPAPSNWHLKNAYTEVFTPLWRLGLSSTVGQLVGGFINIYALSKWKILLKGRYFWLRSIGASAIGEACLNTIGFLIAFIGAISLHGVFELMLASWLYKLIFAAIMAYPANLLVNLLKVVEKTDVYDVDTNFNPLASNKKA
jgi:uncharacterized integral membrane protein (TIGR00697 family)